jgi:hypothetical protein
MRGYQDKPHLCLSALSLIGCGQSTIDNSCSMNGYGSGECSFTNTGSGTGAVFGLIVVTNRCTDI